MGLATPASEAKLEKVANCCTGSVMCGCFADGLRMSLRVIERAMRETRDTPEVEFVWERLTSIIQGVDRRRGDELGRLYQELRVEAPLF